MQTSKSQKLIQKSIRLLFPIEKAVNGAAKILKLVTGHYSAAGEQEIIGEADEDQ
jgi:hypothetical protein